jgi:hypothetical protein
MTVEEVHALMGEPDARGYGPDDALRVEVYGNCPLSGGSVHTSLEVSSPAVMVEFADGRVARKTWDVLRDPTPLERLLASVRERLGW